MKSKGDGVKDEIVFIGEARWKPGRKRAVWIPMFWAIGPDRERILKHITDHFGPTRPVRVTRYVRQLKTKRGKAL